MDTGTKPGLKERTSPGLGAGPRLWGGARRGADPGGSDPGASSPGPVANLRFNLNEVVASLGCTVQLQINNTRAAWRVSTAPLRAVFKDLLVRTLQGQGQGQGRAGGGRPYS